MIEPTQVIALDEVADDLLEGKLFYSEKESWLGNYFWDSLMSDMESLHFSAGIHAKQFGAHRLLTAKFPYAI